MDDQPFVYLVEVSARYATVAIARFKLLNITEKSLFVDSESMEEIHGTFYCPSGRISKKKFTYFFNLRDALEFAKANVVEQKDAIKTALFAKLKEIAELNVNIATIHGRV